VVTLGPSVSQTSADIVTNCTVSDSVELFRSPENHLDVFHAVSLLLLHMHAQNPVLDELVIRGLCCSFECCFDFEELACVL